MDDPLRMHVRPSLRDPVLLLSFEGWSDAGESASTAVRFVSEALHTVPLAELDCEEFYDFTVRRPRVCLDDEKQRHIDWPDTEFRFGSIDESRELVAGLGVEPHLRWRRFTDRVVEMARDLGVRRAVLLGAYLADVVYSRPVKVTGYASDPDELDKLGVERSGYEGPTGILGVLGERLECAGISVVSLWAGLPHYINASPNPRGALALLQVLAPCVGLRLDDEPLRKSAAEFEERVSQLVSDDPELSDYVKQLKRREFAQ